MQENLHFIEKGNGETFLFEIILDSLESFFKVAGLLYTLHGTYLLMLINVHDL